MSKRFLLSAAALLAIGGLAILLMHFLLDPEYDSHQGITENEIVDARRKQFGSEPPATPAPAPIDPSRSIRLAIGGLGLGNDEQNRRVGDLVVTELTGAKGLELVERQSLDKVLREMDLSLSGLVRANDAVRVGKLLRADWFLLGSPVSLNGTNYIVVRVVDGRTGALREAGAFATSPTAPRLAAELAGFVRQCRQNAVEAKSAMYLSVGTFEDFSLNSRQADLPVQLRSYLTAAYQRTNVTVLEREFANTLLKEMQLQLAGMTDEVATNSPVMQSAYWMVDGYYQSYEDSGLEVELVLSIRRLFGRSQKFTLREKPGEPLFRRVKETLDDAMQRERAAVLLSRVTELRAQLASGREIFHAGGPMYSGMGLIRLNSDYSGYNISENEIARRRRNMEEAIRAFETVLLLDPANREAKMYLAACYRQFFINRTEEAVGLYRELIESEPNDSWTGMACQALTETFRRTSPDAKLRWFEVANQGHPNAFYQSQIKAASDEITLEQKGSSGAEQIAENKLFEDAAKWEKDALNGGWSLNFRDLGLEDYVSSFGTNSARAGEALVALLPRLQAASSNLSPYMVAGAVIYQVDKNATVVAQFEKSLTEAASHPEKLFGAKHYFLMVSKEVHNWAASKKLYSLAARTIQMRERMALQKYADPLDDGDKMGLAFGYLGAEAWQPALEIFQSYSNRPVERGFSGNSKGAFMPVFTGRQANFCRKKLGLPVQPQDPRDFTMGTNCLCLHTPSVFQTDADGLWVGIGDQLIRLGFDLKTNFVVTLPTDGDARVTVLSPGTTNLWIGTAGAGLIEFDKASRQCRRLTVKDGLMMDSISSLLIAGDALWIGYGSNEGGGLGRLDLNTRAIRSFTLSLADGTEVQRHPIGNIAAEQFDKPPHRLIQALASGASGEIFFATEDHPLRRYRPREDVWSACPLGSGSCLVADTKASFVGSEGRTAGLGVTAWENANDKVWGFPEASALPLQRVSTLTLDGQALWVGGFGFVALADAADGRVRKFAYVPADKVDQIQIGGGYVWAKFDWHLHRASLRDLD